jgi:hypothetical protein
MDACPGQGRMWRAIVVFDPATEANVSVLWERCRIAHGQDVRIGATVVLTETFPSEEAGPMPPIDNLRQHRIPLHYGGQMPALGFGTLIPDPPTPVTQPKPR